MANLLGNGFAKRRRGLNLLFVYTLNFYFPSLISKGGMRGKRMGIGPVFLGLLLRGYLTTPQKAKLARDSCWFKRGHVREEKKYTESVVHV